MDSFSFSEQRLKQAGLRKTADRKRILELFLQDRTWSAAQIHAELPHLDLSTVYRNLQQLEEKDLLQEAHVHAGERFFEQKTQKHHDHASCTDCGVVACIPCPIPKQQQHHLEILKPCSNCSL